jgi:site-specific DNA-methyltransferase (adenine-specific)
MTKQRSITLCEHSAGIVASQAGARRKFNRGCRYGLAAMRFQSADAEPRLDDDLVLIGENARALATLPDGRFDLIYMDPPFNTGRARSRKTLAATAHQDGEWLGFGGRRYRSRLLQSLAYDDAFADYLSFLEPRLARAHELLAPHGSLYFHIDYREAHYCKLLLDELFGRDAFLNELIWAYDYGAKPRRRWPAKHDTILVYVRTPGAHHFDCEAVEREPYMAPGLVSADKARRGKRPTDVWFHTIVPTNGREKTGYPTQKPEGVLRRIVAASSRPGGWCLDPFAGSGTLGAVCRGLGRRFVLIDHNPAAVEIMRRRLSEGAPGLPAARAVP